MRSNLNLNNNLFAPHVLILIFIFSSLSLSSFCQSFLVVKNETTTTFCIPKSGHTALFIGQDLYSIINYTTSFNTSSFGYMTYTSLNSQNGTNLTGLSTPIDYGSGIEFYDGILDYYFREYSSPPSLNLGLYLVDICEDINKGKLNEHIDRLALFINNTSPSSTCYLRIGYEFDAPWNHYNPLHYILSFQTIVKRFRDLNVKNIAYVWHASGFEPRDGFDIADWYPGDEYVDICAVSLFQQPYGDSCDYGENCVNSMKYVENVFNYCKTRNMRKASDSDSDSEEYTGIPLMIAESTPFGGIIEEVTDHNEAGFYGHSWPNWFHPVLDLIEKYDVRYWSYINCDWDSFPMYMKEHAPGIYWGDSRIQEYNSVRELWIENVLSSKRFKWASEGLIKRNKICGTQSNTDISDSHHNTTSDDDTFNDDDKTSDDSITTGYHHLKKLFRYFDEHVSLLAIGAFVLTAIILGGLISYLRRRMTTAGRSAGYVYIN